MATRFYLPSTGTAPASPAFSAAWDITTSAGRFPMPTSPSGSSVAGTGARAETATTRVNVLGHQYVSTDTIPSARTIGAGTISATLQQQASNTNMDAYMQLVVKVVSGDGATVRGYLYGGATLDTVTATAGAQNEEIVAPSPQTSRIWSAVQLSSVAAQAGDRIVVEIGCRATNTSNFSYSWQASVGDAASATDLPLASGNTSAGVRPWVEFSEDIFAASPGSVSGTLGGTLPNLTGSFAGSYTPPTITGTLGGSLPALAGSFAGTLPDAPIDGTLGGTLPALIGSLVGDISAPVVETSTTYANLGGYNYHGEGEVDYDPPIAPSPARVKPTPIQRVHQSLPVPTLVDGRPV